MVSYLQAFDSINTLFFEKSGLMFLFNLSLCCIVIEGKKNFLVILLLYIFK